MWCPFLCALLLCSRSVPQAQSGAAEPVGVDADAALPTRNSRHHYLDGNYWSAPPCGGARSSGGRSSRVVARKKAAGAAPAAADDLSAPPQALPKWTCSRCASLVGQDVFARGEDGFFYRGCAMARDPYGQMQVRWLASQNGVSIEWISERHVALADTVADVSSLRAGYRSPRGRTSRRKLGCQPLRLGNRLWRSSVGLDAELALPMRAQDALYLARWARLLVPASGAGG